MQAARVFIVSVIAGAGLVTGAGAVIFWYVTILNLVRAYRAERIITLSF